MGKSFDAVQTWDLGSPLRLSAHIYAIYNHHPVCQPHSEFEQQPEALGWVSQVELFPSHHPSSCIKLQESFDHVKSQIQSKQLNPLLNYNTSVLRMDHHRPAHLYSYLKLQLLHHPQMLRQEVFQGYQFAHWGETSCRRQIPSLYADIKSRRNKL